MITSEKHKHYNYFHEYHDWHNWPSPVSEINLIQRVSPVRAVHRPKPVHNFVIRAGFFILFFEPGR